MAMRYNALFFQGWHSATEDLNLVVLAMTLESEHK